MRHNQRAAEEMDKLPAKAKDAGRVREAKRKKATPKDPGLFGEVNIESKVK